jgi:hypothetical protein
MKTTLAVCVCFLLLGFGVAQAQKVTVIGESTSQVSAAGAEPQAVQPPTPAPEQQPPAAARNSRHHRRCRAQAQPQVQQPVACGTGGHRGPVGLHEVTMAGFGCPTAPSTRTKAPPATHLPTPMSTTQAMDGSWLAAPWVWGWGAVSLLRRARSLWTSAGTRGLYRAGYGWGGYRGGYGRRISAAATRRLSGRRTAVAIEVRAAITLPADSAAAAQLAAAIAGATLAAAPTLSADSAAAVAVVDSTAAGAVDSTAVAVADSTAVAVVDSTAVGVANLRASRMPASVRLPWDCRIVVAGGRFTQLYQAATPSQ